jgi:pilus assembly protein Flp/PilA
MLTSWVKVRDLLERLRADKDGMASFEYVIVAACIVGAVSAVFGGTGAGTVLGALTTGLAAIGTAIAG